MPLHKAARPRPTAPSPASTSWLRSWTRSRNSIWPARSAERTTRMAFIRFPFSKATAEIRPQTGPMPRSTITRAMHCWAGKMKTLPSSPRAFHISFCGSLGPTFNYFPSAVFSRLTSPGMSGSPGSRSVTARPPLTSTAPPPRAWSPTRCGTRPEPTITFWISACASPAHS